MLHPKEKKILLDPKQQADMKKIAEEKAKQLAEEFKIKKEALMREVGVIEIAILKQDFTPLKGLHLTPDSVIVPHAWKDDETYIKNEQSESKPAGHSSSGIITG